VHCSIESRGRLFGGDSPSGFDLSRGLGRLQRPGRLIDVPSDISGGVTELRASTEQDLGPGEPAGDHDQCGPARVGTTADCRGPSTITRGGVGLAHNALPAA
jgi:hypothetical protein